ncbi:MAG: ATP-dependent RNA helicase HrpA [Xanthomonadales bacterium]|nr:ATP-dependent RNA helicase HrpA [Xanthomonadales bacterium]
MKAQQPKDLRKDARTEQRLKARPPINYDDALPITAARDEILAALQRHQVLIVAGETGSGKTTQLPKMLLQAGFGCHRLIGCTQPRRIAATAMASRVAEELQTELGSVVGFQVRFREKLSAETYIKFMTDGVLLAETIRDPLLLKYDAILIDEAHERSLNIDFLLGYLKTLLPRRRDLKLVITSATIDTEKFSAHFAKAPVITVSGRGFPVDIEYQPLASDGEDSSGKDSEPGDQDLYRGIADAVRRVSRIDPRGDILVFLSGEREIREAGEYLLRQSLPHTEVLPLYARLSSAEQQRVFHPGPQRRIILSTNVAETSLTVPRIRFVIDSGLARISRYAHRSRIQRLPIEAISQASANQRAGRCGRVGPGTCIRLYDKDEFSLRPEFTEPEILRTSLGSVILRMLVMGLGEVEDFPFIDSPAPRMINEAYDLLLELQAMTRDRQPTDLGRQLDRWPLDPRLGRMVAEGARLSCLEDVLVLVAALSIQDPRERPLDRQQAADQAHQPYQDEKSDFAGLLKLWLHLKEQRRSLSGNQFRKVCKREFLNWQRVLEWFDLYQQLRDQAREEKLRLGGGHGNYEQVHQALLSGMLSHVGLRHPEDGSYTGARQRSFRVFPGSGLYGKTPKWIMAAEVVETTRAWGRINAQIEPSWIEQQGAHLLKQHYFDPHWSRKSGRVQAWEQVSMFGLVIVEKRRVDYGRIAPAEAREIFLLEALVRGELDLRSGFMRHNAEIRAEVAALEDKRRRHDLLADEHTVFDFFAARVPEDVCDARTFAKWLERIGPRGREQLYLGHDVLLREDAAAVSEEQFPDQLKWAGHDFALKYRFEPGHEADGVTLVVPLDRLNTLQAGRLQWLVPGLLRDKLEALIRALPKPVRRALTPVPQFADALQQILSGRQSESLLAACAKELSRMTGLELQASSFNEQALEAHLCFRIEVVDENGQEIAAGRDLEALQLELGKTAQREFMDRQGQGVNRDGATAWEFGSLQQETKTASGATAWPALVDQENAVGLRLFDTFDGAWLSHQAGVLRLLRLQLADKLVWLYKHPGLSRECQIAWSALTSVESLMQDLVESSLVLAASDVWAIRDATAFEDLSSRVRSRIGGVSRQQADVLNSVIPQLISLRSEIAKGRRRAPLETLEDIQGQMADLLYPGFLTELEAGNLQHFPRYVAAIEERLQQAADNPQRDLQRLQDIKPFQQNYQQRLESGADYDAALDEYRWLLAEYRVSVFAQRLGTATKVSAKRLQQAWREVVK